MPKNLTNRLDKLETQLVSLLQLQEVAKSCRSTAASQHTAAEGSPRRNHLPSSEKDKMCCSKNDKG
ncbi:unnamed protein product, partial [Timema podura]|nr:unnamed protein product [Timema podura]